MADLQESLQYQQQEQERFARNQAWEKEDTQLRESRWESGSYDRDVPMFDAGSNASPDDFLALLGLGESSEQLEGKILTRVWPKTQVAPEHQTLYFKLGDQKAPDGVWSRRQVWQVTNGVWSLVTDEQA